MCSEIDKGTTFKMYILVSVKQKDDQSSYISKSNSYSDMKKSRKLGSFVNQKHFIENKLKRNHISMLALQNSYLQGGFFGKRNNQGLLNRTTEQKIHFSQNFDMLERILEKRSSENLDDYMSNLYSEAELTK